MYFLISEDPSCVDFFSWCHLVPQHGVCNHKFYGKQCCKSCTRKSWSWWLPQHSRAVFQAFSTSRETSCLPEQKLNTAKPLVSCRVQGASSEDQTDLFSSPKHMVLWSTWKWEAMTYLTYKKTKTEQLSFALLHERSDESHWDTSNFNFDKARVLSTLGQIPLWTSKGSMTKTSVLKSSFRTSGQRLRLGAITSGWNTLPNCYLELTVWTVDTLNQEFYEKPNGAHDCACCWTSKLHVMFI